MTHDEIRATIGALFALAQRHGRFHDCGAANDRAGEVSVDAEGTMNG